MNLQCRYAFNYSNVNKEVVRYSTNAKTRKMQMSPENATLEHLGSEEVIYEFKVSKFSFSYFDHMYMQ